MVASNYAPGLLPLLRPVADLTLDPANARSHPERNLDSIKESLTRFGQQKPIVVAPDGVVLAGNGTLVAARALGWTHIAVIVTNLAGPDARGYALADNRSAETAEWDVERLIEELRSLPDGMAEGIGWDEGEMRRVAHDAEMAIEALRAELADDVVPEPPAVPVTRPGDLWLLGQHRLLCGDSTKAEDVARLMNGEKASLLATDPPYLVDYTGGDHPQSYHNKPDVKDKTWDAYVDPETSVAFFENYHRHDRGRSRPALPSPHPLQAGVHGGQAAPRDRRARRPRAVEVARGHVRDGGQRGPGDLGSRAVGAAHGRGTRDPALKFPRFEGGSGAEGLRRQGSGRFELVGGLVAEGGMPPAGVVPALDVREHLASGLVA